MILNLLIIFLFLLCLKSAYKCLCVETASIYDHSVFVPLSLNACNGFFFSSACLLR